MRLERSLLPLPLINRNDGTTKNFTFPIINTILSVYLCSLSYTASLSVNRLARRFDCQFIGPFDGAHYISTYDDKGGRA